MGPCYDTDRLIALGIDPRVPASDTDKERRGLPLAPLPRMAVLLLRWRRRQPMTVKVSPGPTRPPAVTRA